MPNQSFFSGIELVVMLKEAIIEIVHDSLSDYFETLDTSQLSISLWAGDVVLHDLIIKTTAIEGSTGLPIKVASGKIGKLCIKIPWASLFRSAVEISITELYLLLVPSYAEYDKETEEKISLILKKNIVQRFEDGYKEYSIRRSGEPIDDSYTEKLTMQIVRNMQIKLESIHIRYEDNISQTIPFSIGVLLKSLSVHTTDESWKPMFIAQVLDTVHKQGILEGFSFYWNINSALMSTGRASREDILQELKDSLADESGLSHVIGPIEADVKLSLTPDSEKTYFRFPRINAAIFFSEVALGINQNQFEDGLRILETLEFITRNQHYKQYKPLNLKKYKGSYKRWWKFAYDCVLEDVRRRRRGWNWRNMKMHRRLFKLYIEAYYKKSTTKNPGKELKEEINRLEKSLDAFNIILARKLVQLRLKRLEKIETAKKPGWIMSWFVNYRLSSEEINSISSNKWSSEEKEQLQEILLFRNRLDSMRFPEDYEILRVNFRINKLTFTLSEVTTSSGGYPQEEAILKFKITDFTTNVSRRPINNGFKFELALGSIAAEGLYSRQQIISNCDNGCRFESAPSKNVFELTLENKPLRSSVDQKIKLIAQPLQLTYHYQTLQKLIDAFVIPIRNDLHERMNSIAAEKLVEFKEFSTSKIKQLIKSRLETELTINFLAPYILIPKDGEIKANTTVLGVDLGKLIVLSQNKTEEDETQHLEVEKRFDSYTVELRDFQIFIALPGENHEYRSLTRTNHLINYDLMILNVKHFHSKRTQELPTLKVEANIPIINIDIAQQRFLELVHLVVTLPLPLVEHILANHPASQESSSILREKAKIAPPPQPRADVRLKQLSFEIDSIERVDIAVDARVNSVKIRLNQDEKKLLTFTFWKMTVKIVSKSFSDDYEIVADGITLSILGYQVSGKQGPLYLINTVNKDKTAHPAKIQINTVSRSCPDIFLPAIANSVVVQLTSINFTLHQQALSTMLKLLDGFKNPELTTTLEGMQLSRKRIPSISKVNIKLRVDATLQALALRLATENKNIVRFVLQGLKGSVEVAETSAKIMFSLKEVTGYPTETQTPYQKMLVVEGGKAIETSITLNKLASPQGPPDVTLEVKIAPVFAIITPKFIMNMKEFYVTLLNFDGKNGGESEKSKPLEGAGIKRRKFLINVQIEPPKLVFPRTETSSDALLLNLGKLTFKNEFLARKLNDGVTTMIDEIDFHLKDAKISRIYINFDTQAVAAEVHLLNPISFQCKVTRNMMAPCIGLPNVKVIVRLENNILRIDIEDFQIWRNIVQQLLTPVMKQQAPTVKDAYTSTESSSFNLGGNRCEDLVMELVLEKLEVILYGKVLSLRDKQGVVTRDPRDAFGFFSLSDIRGFCKTWTNSDVAAELAVGELVVEDTQAFTEVTGNLHKNIITRNPPFQTGQPGTSFNPFLKITFKNGTIRDPKKANTHVELPALSINMYSEFMTQVLKFFTAD